MKIPFPKIPKLKGLTKPPIGGLKAASSKRHVFVLEVGDVWMKMAAAKDGKIISFDASMLEGISDLDISQKIAAFVQKEIPKPDEVIIAHPSHSLTMRILSLPSTDPREIKDIVDLQAVKQTPYSRDEITTGFRIIDRDEAGYSRVLVAISHREVAGRYFKLNELAAITHSRMTAAAEGAQSWVGTLIQKGKIFKDESVLVLDMDWVTADLLIFQKGEMIFSRSLGLGAKNLQEQGAPMEAEIVREVQRSMESLSAEHQGLNINRVLLTGVQKNLKDFSAALVRELNIPCEVHSVLEDFPSSDAASMLEHEKEFSVSFSSVLAIAASPQRITLDLTPQEIQIRRGLEARAKELVMLGTLCLALISIASLISVEKMYKKSSYLNLLRKQYHSVSGEAEGVERLVAKMKLAHEQNDTFNDPLDVLKDINEVIPNNIVLTAFQYNRGDQSLVLRGTSSEMSTVFQFLTTLENTPTLEQVKTRNVTKRKVDNKELAEFEIAAHIFSASQKGPGAPALAAIKTTVPASQAPDIPGAK